MQRSGRWPLLLTRAAAVACAAELQPKPARASIHHSTKAHNKIIKGYIIKLLMQPGYRRNVNSPEPKTDALISKAGGTNPQQTTPQQLGVIAQALHSAA